MTKKALSAEEEEKRNNKWIQGKMRNTRKRPFTIAQSREVYDMSSPVRGWCLIFSNHVFKALDKLLGYERDKENFKKVFVELGFKVKIFEKVTAEEIKHNMQKYANISASNGSHPTNALVVVVLSHGSGNCLFGVSYSENEPNDKISVDEIKDIVSNQNCPHLIDKPKIFFLQACRGDKQDLGLNVLSLKTMNNENQNPIPVATMLRSGRRLYDEKDEKMGILPSVGEEIIIIYPASSNYASYVPLTGSLFGVQLCVELKRWAWKKHLYDIILSVNNAVRIKEIAIGNKQSVKQVLEMHFTSPTKKLYFNPGYYVKSNISTSDEATTSAASNVNNMANVPKDKLNENIDLAEQQNVPTTNGENAEPVPKSSKTKIAPRTKQENEDEKGQPKIFNYFKKQKTSDDPNSAANAAKHL